MDDPKQVLERAIELWNDRDREGWAALYTDDEIIRARNATLLARPKDVKAYFSAQFRKIIPAQPAQRPMAGSIRTVPENDPYGF